MHVRQSHIITSFDLYFLFSFSTFPPNKKAQQLLNSFFVHFFFYHFLPILLSRKYIYKFLKYLHTYFVVLELSDIEFLSYKMEDELTVCFNYFCSLCNNLFSNALYHV
jgi:hypothetical protein